MRKLELVVNGPVRSGVRGQSVKSIVGLADCMLVNSAVSSVKIVASSVSIAGPAGTQNSEHAPEEPTVWHVCGIAGIAGMDGRWKSADMGPVRLTRENATAKTTR